MIMKPTNSQSISKIASGAGAAFIGRLGAFMEAGSLFIFTWLYGVEVFGLYAIFWSYGRVLSAVSSGAMSLFLQRQIPTETPHQQRQTLVLALIFCLGISFLIAILIVFLAPFIAIYIHFTNDIFLDKEQLIRIYAFIIPAWTFLEVGTAAIRAKGKFGPEIKIRIFYEQALRLAFAFLFFQIGFEETGLFLAHLISVIMAGFLILRLLLSHYRKSYSSSVKKQTVLVKPNMPAKEKIKTAMYLLPGFLTRRLVSELPIIMLGTLLPANSAVVSAGAYALARKFASLLQVIKIVFDYVLAPLSAETNHRREVQYLMEMVLFATRISLIIALPVAALLIVLIPELLIFFPQEMSIAFVPVIILLLGRLCEIALGPAITLVETLCKPYLSTINSFVSLGILILGCFIFIPLMGIEGAAITAATAMIIPAFLAHQQVRRYTKLIFYDQRIIKYVVSGFTSGLVLLIPIKLYTNIDPMIKVGSVISSLILIFIVIFKFILISDDRAALGRMGSSKQND